MTALPILRRSLADGWRGLLLWAVGLVAALSLYLPIFPSLGGDGQMQELIDSLPPELVNALGYDDIATGAGYTQATFLGLFGFVLLAIASTAWGSAAIAGAEESGRLELALAHAVTRVQYVLESAVAILIRLLVLGTVIVGMILLLDEPSELGLEPSHVVAGVSALVLLAFLCASAALAAGAITGRRAIATGAGAGVAVASYTLNALANQSADLESLRDWSPYGWAYRNAPLAEGWDAPGLLLLGGCGVLLIAIATVALHRRDLS